MIHRSLIAMLALGVLANLAGPGRACAESPEPIKAITSPSTDLTLSFTRAGLLAKIMVAQGQYVHTGDLLAKLEDSVEQKHLDLLKAKADDTTGIQAAELKSKKADDHLANVRQAFENNAAPQRELTDAQFDAAMAKIDLASAKLDHAQAVGQYVQAQLDMRRMRLTSPADGEIEQIIAKQGESVDALAPVLRLVNVDPLWIDTPVPLDIARHITAGSVAMVRLPGASGPVKGKVIHVARVADPASKTVEIRVELANPKGRIAGEHVTVTFPARSGNSSATPTSRPAGSGHESK